jgi:hypothetical protein
MDRRVRFIFNYADGGQVRVTIFHAIAAASQAIFRLLNNTCPKNEFQNAGFALYHRRDFETSSMKKDISLFLYRVAPNGTLRNLQSRLESDGRRYRPSLPLHLHYVLTAWANSVEHASVRGTRSCQPAPQVTLCQSQKHLMPTKPLNW